MPDMDRSDFPRYGYYEISMDDLGREAYGRGYRPTEHGTWQRGLWRAVRLTPVGSGVVLRRAWTTAQIITVGVFLTLVGIFLFGS